MLKSPNSLGELCVEFRRLTEQENGVNLLHLLDSERGGKVALRELQPGGRNPQDFAIAQGGPVYGESLGLYLSCLQAGLSGEPVREAELICTCLKTWVQIYIEADGTGLWMTPLMMFFCKYARRTATQLDKAKRSESNSDSYLKKLVEIHREMFQNLNREKTKRAGHVWVCCELLRAYFKLGQISQCSFLLNAVSQSLNRDGFNPTDLPKAISVTFFFYWGKHCVFTHNLPGADDKLTWAFNNCPEKSNSNRRKILLYLVPCKLRLGVLPSQKLLKSYNLTIFGDIVRAIREGNVQLFAQKMEEHASDFIKMGTYLSMMKLKFTVLRSLTRNVHREVRKNLEEKQAHKMDLAPFVHVFNWQDGCDADETACIISNLIYQGALKGYLSHEHQKIVFAKDSPFPPPSKWRMER